MYFLAETEELLFQIRVFSLFAFFSFCLLLWILRRQKKSHPQLSLHESYLGYFLLPYSEIQPEILKQIQEAQPQLLKFLKRLEQQNALGSLWQKVLLQAHAIQGKFYKKYQPYLRLKKGSNPELLSLEPTINAFFQEMSSFLAWYEKQTLPPQKQNSSLSLVPPEEPCPPEEWERLPLEARTFLQNLSALEESFTFPFSRDTLLLEWMVLQEGAARLLEKEQIHCFHCALREFHTIAQAAHCHPFSPEKFLALSSNP